ncbi:MAG: hypothetical protein IJ757_08645 [Clostridiales bacterium]|nr:hypothetical protein [Clostridiales bacterium]
MKSCTFCGCVTDNKNNTCASCGSTTFLYVCPNCSNKFEGSYCPECGVRFDAVQKVCPECGTKYYSGICPNCKYTAKVPRRYITNRRPDVEQSNSPEASLATLSFALGLIGLITNILPLSIIGLVLSVKAKKSGCKSQVQMAGYIVSLIAVIFTSLVYLVFIIAVIISNTK